MKVLRSLCLVLVCAMCFAMAVGCGSAAKSDTKKIVATTKAGDDSTDKTTAEETSADATTEDTTADTSANDTLSIEPGVLLDQDGVKITATGLVEDEYWGVGISLLIENSTDKNIDVMCNSVIVNNFTITDIFFSTVTASNKANETLYLSSDELAAIGINTIGEIQIYFNVYDSDSSDTILDSDCITIKTSQFANMDTTSMDGGYILVDQDGIKIIGKYVDENSFWGTSILLYIENNSDKNVSINCDDLSINGFMIDPYFGCTVYAGAKAMPSISILQSDLDANGITSIDKIQLSFTVLDDATFDTLFVSDPVFFAAK